MVGALLSQPPAFTIVTYSAAIGTEGKVLLGSRMLLIQLVFVYVTCHTSVHRRTCRPLQPDAVTLQYCLLYLIVRPTEKLYRFLHYLCLCRVTPLGVFQHRQLFLKVLAH